METRRLVKTAEKQEHRDGVKFGGGGMGGMRGGGGGKETGVHGAEAAGVQ